MGRPTDDFRIPAPSQVCNGEEPSKTGDRKDLP